MSSKAKKLKYTLTYTYEINAYKSLIYIVVLAERTGLEPATPGVTGRYSNQLNYRSNR